MSKTIFSFTEDKYDLLIKNHAETLSKNQELANAVKSLKDDLDSFKASKHYLGDLHSFFTQGKVSNEILTRTQKETFGKILFGIHQAYYKKDDDYLEKLMDERKSTLPFYKQKAMSTIGTEGLLMLDDIDNTIHTLIEDHTFLATQADWRTTDANTLKLYKHLTSITVSSVNEGADLPETEIDFSEVSATSSKIGAMILYSSEIDEDIFIDLADYIVMDIIRMVAKELERVALVGNTGSGDPYMGLLNDTNIPTYTLSSGNTQFSQADWTDYHKGIDSIDEATDGEPIWVMHRNVFGHQERAVDDNGQPIFKAFGNANPKTLNGYKGQFLGFDLYTNSLMPGNSASAASTYWAWFGIMKNIRVIVRRALTIKHAKELYMRSDQLATMFTQRYILLKLHPTTGVRYRTAAS